MGHLKITKAKVSITKRNASHYVVKSIPYISLIISLISILKAYNVIR